MDRGIEEFDYSTFNDQRGIAGCDTGIFGKAQEYAGYKQFL